MTERKQRLEKETNLITKSIFMTIAWLNFYAINWYILSMQKENAFLHVFMWILFAALAVISANYKEPKDKE